MISFQVINPRSGLPPEKTSNTILTNQYAQGATVKIYWLNSLVGTGVFDGVDWDITTAWDIPSALLPTNTNITADIPVYSTTSATIESLDSIKAAGSTERRLSDIDLSLEYNDRYFVQKNTSNEIAFLQHVEAGFLPSSTILKVGSTTKGIHHFEYSTYKGYL